MSLPIHTAILEQTLGLFVRTVSSPERTDGISVKRGKRDFYHSPSLLLTMNSGYFRDLGDVANNDTKTHPIETGIPSNSFYIYLDSISVRNRQAVRIEVGKGRRGKKTEGRRGQKEEGRRKKEEGRRKKEEA